MIYTRSAQPELCLFFNHLADIWGRDFPEKERGLDTYLDELANA